MKKGAYIMKYYMFNGLENNKKNKPKKELNKKKVLKLSILLACVLLIVIFTILYSTNEKCREIFDKYIFRKEVYENNLPSINIDSSKNVEACAYDKYIGVLEQNVFKIYNKAGAQEQSLDIDISTPIFESNGEYLCIAQKNGPKIYLIANKNIVWQSEVDGKISSVSVNKNGYVTVTISGTSYKTVLMTYNSQGNELFKTYLSTTNVIDTDISNDNKYLAIAEVNFSGIVVQSSIKVISIEEAQKKSSEPIKYTHLAQSNDLLINIKYHNKNELVCMYDGHIDVFKEGQNTQLINFSEHDLIVADINFSDKISTVVKKSTGLFSAEAEMKIINTNNQKEVIYAIENVPKKIIVQDNIIAINLGTSALHIIKIPM